MNFLAQFSGPGPAFTYTCIIRLFCVALLLTALEFLNIIAQFGKGGIYSWKIIKLNIHPNILKLKPDLFFNKTGVSVIFSTRLACSIYLFIHPISPATPYLLGAIVLTALILSIRIPIGSDGSDQMSTIIAVSLFIAFLCHDPKIAAISLYFIAAQSVISYVIAGSAKLLSKKWRNGTAVYQIMNTESFGSESISAYLHRSPPVIATIMSWNVMLFETIFFTVVILPYPYFLIFLIWGIVFHFYNAIIMGLNNFFWVFLSTYPAIIYCNIVLHNYFS